MLPAEPVSVISCFGGGLETNKTTQVSMGIWLSSCAQPPGSASGVTPPTAMPAHVTRVWAAKVPTSMQQQLHCCPDRGWMSPAVLVSLASADSATHTHAEYSGTGLRCTSSVVLSKLASSRQHQGVTAQAECALHALTAAGPARPLREAALAGVTTVQRSAVLLAEQACLANRAAEPW